MEAYKTLVFLSALILSILYLYRLIIIIKDIKESPTDSDTIILFIISILWAFLYFLN